MFTISTRDFQIFEIVCFDSAFFRFAVIYNENAEIIVVETNRSIREGLRLLETRALSYMSVSFTNISDLFEPARDIYERVPHSE
jgi:hypothetical protein